MYTFHNALPGPAARVILTWSLVLLCSGGAFGAAEETKPVRIGVLAKRGTQRCLEKWGPTADYLTEQIPGYRFAVTPLGHNQVYAAVERGEADFILANPSFYVTLERLYGARRIVTLKNLDLAKAHTAYAGVIFRRSGRTDLRELRDLKGKRFMAVDEGSFGGWQMAWRELKAEGMDPYRDFSDLQFGGTHDAVVDAVREGKADAGTVRTDALERMAAEGKIRLEEFQIIHQQSGGEVDLPFLRSTRIYPEWPLAKAREASDELAQQVAIALMRMSPEMPAAKAARCAGWTIPANYQPVHECLKELRIGPYQDYGKVTLRDVIRRYWLSLLGALMVLAAACIVSVYVMRLNRALRQALSKHKKELADRKRAEETLRLSETRLRQIIDLVPHMVFAKDKEGRFLLTNRVTAEAYGMTVEQLTGKRQADIHPVEEEVRRMLEDDRAVIESGRAKTVAEEPFQGADGKLRMLHTVKIPYKASGTSEPAVLGVAIDVTELKRAEEALRESQGFLQTVIDTIPEVTMVIERDHRVVLANKAAREMAGGKDPVGSRSACYQVLHKRNVPCEEVPEPCPWARVIESKAPATVIHTHRDPSGNEAIVEISAAPVFDDAGEVVQVVESCRDITERVEAEEALRRSEQLRAQTEKLAATGRLAAGVAHEINNPLTGVLTFAHLLREKENMDDQDRQDLDLIIHETTRAGEIVCGLLEFARERPAEKEPLDVNDVVRRTVRLLGNQEAFQQIALREDFWEDLPRVDADMNQLQQVLLNLSLNACEAMPNGGTLTISTLAQDQKVLVKVTDTGCGIKREHLDRIFEPFFSTKPTGKGTGLGLSVSYGIVQQHGGSLEVESEEGKGTTFTVVLPSLQDGPSAGHEEMTGS